jgi:hypothetical protein
LKYLPKAASSVHDGSPQEGDGVAVAAEKLISIKIHGTLSYRIARASKLLIFGTFTRPLVLSSSLNANLSLSIPWLVQLLSGFFYVREKVSCLPAPTTASTNTNCFILTFCVKFIALWARKN